MRVRRRPNHRLVKIHRSYAVEEIAQRLEVHKNTVRAWMRAGLNAIDDRRPMLISGAELFEFLKEKRQQKKRPCQPGEMFCVRCRAAKKAAGNMADYIPITEAFGNLEGICPDCGGMIFRRASLAKLEQIRGQLDIQFREE
jgi:excisionase family DNA binding protein